MEINSKMAKSVKNAEKRRERSKVAARCRRGKESEIFNDLSESLPIPESCKSTLDKASVMRLTLCNLGIKNMINSGFMNESLSKSKSMSVETGAEGEFISQMNEALGGFILVFGLDGDVIYASEAITPQLGISQYEIMGQSIFDFSHQYDHNDIRSMLLVHKKGEVSGNEAGPGIEKRSCLFRMKCTVSSRGRNAHLRSANYKVINCVGRIVEEKSGGGANHENNKWFVSICEPLLHPSDVDIPLNKQSFLSKHSPDMKFEYVDEAVGELLGYTREEMMGRSLFEFSHAGDGVGMAKAFKSLYDKEQNQTDCYRFLTKGGGWIWVMTQATVIHGSGPANKTPNSVVCIHFIITGREEEDQILSEVQIGQRAIPVPTSTHPALAVVPMSRGVLVERRNNFKSKNSMNSDDDSNFIADLLVGPLLNQATCSTAKIFAPKTKEMDTGFLMPVNIDGHGDKLMVASKELEPDDLTHLAPIAGDECVPLDVPLLEDLLASLDEDDLSYSFLDGDSDEVMAFEAGQMPKLMVTSSPPIQLENGCFTSTSSPMNPMMLGADPVLASSGSVSPSMFHNSPASCSPSTDWNLSPRPSAISIGGPGVQQLGREGQDLDGHLRGGGGGGGMSPIPPDLCLIPPMLDPIMEFQPQVAVGAWINTNLQNGIRSEQLVPFLEGNSNSVQKSIGATANQDSLGIKKSVWNSAGTGSPPNKVQKLEDTGAPRAIGHVEAQQNKDSGREKIYILVPVRRRSDGSPPNSSGYDSDLSSSSSSSDDQRYGGQKDQLDLVNLVRAQQIQIQQQAEINNQLRARIGLSENISSRKRNFAGSFLDGRNKLSFHELSRQDCEANAPLSKNADLLMGPDLLHALEIGGPVIPI